MKDERTAENGGQKRTPLQRLIDEILAAAVCAESDSTPVVLVCDPDSRPFELRLRHDWPVRVMGSDEELVRHASIEVADRPTVILPRWGGRIQGSRLAIHERTLLNIESDGPSHPLVAVIPAFSLVSERGLQFRESFFKAWHPNVIAFITGGLDGVSHSTGLAVLVLAPQGERTAVTRMFEAPPKWQEMWDDVADDFAKLLKMRGGTRMYGYVLRDAPEPGASMCFREHDPRVAQRRRQLADFGKSVRLDELFEVLPPGRSLAMLARVQEGQPGATRYISGREIQRSNRIASPDENSIWVEADEGVTLQVGDIVMRGLHGGPPKTGFVWSRVCEFDLPLMLGNTTLALRARGDTSPTVEDFILRFIGSHQAPELIEGAGTTRPSFSLTPAVVSALQVPVPDEPVEVALTAVRYARDRAGEWQAEAGALLDSIFDEDCAADSRQRILRESRAVRWRVQTADAAADFGEQVRRQFPYPIAYRWRVADALLSADPSRDGYLAVLDAAEQILAYTANIALALAHSAELEIGAVVGIRKKLAVGQGPGMGDWSAVLEEVGGKGFSSIDLLLGTGDLREFCQSEDIRAARRWLSSRRNDEAHNRRIDATQLRSFCDDARDNLLILLRGASFLVDLPLLLIDSMKWDSLADSGLLTFRKLSGDHPVVRLESMKVSEPAIEAGSLYILDIDRQLHLLRPFLVGLNCPTCRSLSVFHIDKVQGDEVTIKSLEHGHIVTDAALRDPLRRVGFIEWVEYAE